MSKIFNNLFLIIFSLFILVPTVKAADLNVECFGTGICTKSGLDPLFSKTLDGYFLPGISLTKTINLKNSSVEIKEIAIKATRTSLAGILENVMAVNLSPAGGGTVWSGSLADFYGLSNISLGNLDPGQNKDFNFTVNMAPLAGNEYQDKETVFDLTLGFWATEAVPTPTPTPSGGGGGGITGGGVSASPCSDTKPGVPTGLTAVVGPGTGQVSLSWIAPSPPYTYFLVAYSDNSSWPPKWGNPDVGNVTSYIVSGLGSGTYWFWLRAGNGCMPGDFTGPVSPGAIMGIPGAPVAVGFLPGVLGEATPSGQIQGQETGGEVAGVGEGICQKCIWWPILLGEFLSLVIFYQLVLKKYGSRRNYFISIIIPIAAYVIFFLLNKNCLSESFFCRYFWLLDLGLFIVFIGLVKSWKDLISSS